MPKDIIITPASGLVDFKDNSGISSATIQLDDSGNLNISNPGGNLTLGDTSTDIFVGDGVNNVDIVFEQDGEIRGLTNKTVSLGQTDSYIKVVGGLKDSNNQVGIAGSILVSTGAGVSWTNSLGAITFTGNVSFGTSAYFGDNDTLYFGDGGDLRIYHSGSNSFIDEVGTGDLFLRATNIYLQQNGGETALNAIQNGAVELYYDNSKKFETTGYGVTVYGTTETQQLVVSGVCTFQGNVFLGDDDILNLGDSSEFQIRHRVNGDSSIVETGSGALYIGGSRVIIAEGYSSNLMADFTDNGSVDLYHNHIKKFETTGYGATVYGTLESQGLNVSGVSTSTGGFVGNLTGTATTATNLADAANITTGTINSARLSGTYGINVSYASTAGIATVAQGLTGTPNITVGTVNATSFVKSGGTSSQFLKADGSVDSNTYLTTTGSGTNLTGIVTSIVAGDNITISGSTGKVTINSTATGGGSGTFDIGITTSIYVSVTSGIGTNSLTTNNIFVGPGIAYSFPSTSGKKYVIESIHITNTFSNELYFTARHDFNGGSNVPLAQRVIVPYQGATQFLDQPIIANPSDILRFQALSNTTSSATGIDGGLDAFIVYSEKTDTNYIGTGKTVTTAAGTEIFQTSSNPAMLQSIKLCNYDLNTDIDASISIYRGSLASGVRLGYLVYNLTIPKNSVIEILEKPAYLAASDSIVGGSSVSNTLGVTLSGKYIV